jgi:hypothetical protein
MPYYSIISMLTPLMFGGKTGLLGFLSAVLSMCLTFGIKCYKILRMWYKFCGSVPLGSILEPLLLDIDSINHPSCHHYHTSVI